MPRRVTTTTALVCAEEKEGKERKGKMKTVRGSPAPLTESSLHLNLNTRREREKEQCVEQCVSGLLRRCCHCTHTHTISVPAAAMTLVVSCFGYIFLQLSTQCGSLGTSGVYVCVCSHSFALVLMLVCWPGLLSLQLNSWDSRGGPLLPLLPFWPSLRGEQCSGLG